MFKMPTVVLTKTTLAVSLKIRLKMPGLNQLRNRMTKDENNLLGDLTKDSTLN